MKDRRPTVKQAAVEAYETGFLSKNENSYEQLAKIAGSLFYVQTPRFNRLK